MLVAPLREITTALQEGNKVLHEPKMALEAGRALVYYEEFVFVELVNMEFWRSSDLKLVIFSLRV